MTASLTDAEIEQRLLAAAPRLRRFLARLAGRAEDVEDLMQEAMARAWRSRHRLDPQRGSESWLLRIGFRAHLDLRARRGRHPEPLAAEDEAWQPPAAADAEIRDELERVLRALSELERDVLLRRHRDGLAVAEIAAALGMPPNTVKSHLHRARRKLPGGHLL